MNGIVQSINSTGAGFVRFALPMLIQSGALIIILLLLDVLLRKRVRAVFRYWIWMLVLVKLVLPVSLSSPVSVGSLLGDKLEVAEINAKSERITTPVQPPAAPAQVTPPPPASNIVDVSAIRPMMYERSLYQPAPVNVPPAELQQPHQAPPPEPAPEAIPLTWQAVVFMLWLGVVVAMSLLLLQRVLFVRGLLAQSVPAGNGMRRLLTQCCQQMRIRRNLELRVSVNATSPAVCGLLRPTILMPYNIAPTS